MKFSMLVFVSLFAGASLFGSQVSFARESESKGLMFLSQPRPEWKPEIVSFVGEVRCMEGKGDDGDTSQQAGCEARLIRADGKVLRVDSDNSLAKLASQSPAKHLLVKVEVEKTPKFLFWGGNLELLEFEILDETSSGNCLLAKYGQGLNRVISKPRLL